MKRSIVVWILKGFLVGSAVAAPSSGTVVTAPGSTQTGQPLNPSPSDDPRQPQVVLPPVPPPMPAGFVVVSTNHIDQVATTAKFAIEAAKASEEALVRLLGIAGSVIGIGLALAAFFGIKEFKDIRDKHHDLAKQYEAQLKELEAIKNETVPKLHAMLAQSQEMEGILIDLSFLRNVNQQIAELVKKTSPDLKKTALEALPEGKRLFDRAQKHYENVLQIGPLTAGGREARIFPKMAREFFRISQP